MFVRPKEFKHFNEIPVHTIAQAVKLLAYSQDNQYIRHYSLLNFLGLLVFFVVRFREVERGGGLQGCRGDFHHGAGEVDTGRVRGSRGAAWEGEQACEDTTSPLF